MSEAPISAVQEAAPLDSIIETPRLRLTRLTDTSTGSRDLQWYHENWSDLEATKWSLHGACKTIEDSQEWMKVNMNQDTIDNLFYSIHARDNSKADGYGQHLGSICLRLRPKGGPTFPLPNAVPDGKSLYFRELGYALFEAARGKGYCTEAGQALLDTYKKYRSQFNDKEVSWVEAIVGGANPGSIKVLTKLGFQNQGKFTDVEPVFLAGAWHRDGYWVYGMPA